MSYGLQKDFMSSINISVLQKKFFLSQWNIFSSEITLFLQST